MLNSLFNSFDNIVVFDVETTGFDSKRDEIIEIAVLKVVNEQNVPVVESEYCSLIRLTPNRSLPSAITNLTGISEQQLQEDGVSKDSACAKVLEVLNCQKLLLVAYNAQFDLSFLYHFLSRQDKAGVLKDVKMLDVLTVYRDRRPYPHKLSDAAQAYSLGSGGAHRALDDARVTFELLCAMGEETDDLARYVNLFGYNPKYGISGSKISSVKYLPQGYYRTNKLYEE